MQRFQLLATYFFAIAFSAWLGRADMHTDDTGILAGLIGIGAFGLAAIEPRRPWIWGLLVPGGVIGVEFWNRIAVTGRGAGDVVGIAAFTLAVATAGAYLGAFIRRAFIERPINAR